MHTSASFSAALMFTFHWGVMMALMMLPSAAPMILLYRTVSTRLSEEQHARSIPATVFAGVYLTVWTLIGLPVYLLWIALPNNGLHPYMLAAVLALAGVYQLSSLKRVCLRYCESPLSFLMQRWQNGYANTLKIALQHASYCIGCCWALMLILVAAGAMSLPWVIAIAAVVYAEKVLPHGERTAKAIGVLLIAMAVLTARL